jgi:hypothetical protein
VTQPNGRRRALMMTMIWAGFCAGWAIAPANAAPPLTTIQDTLYRADGTPYTGTVQIEWKSFQASDNTMVPAQSLSLRIYRGLFKTQLVPTTTASSGAVYTVRYLSDGRQHALEYWAVPPSNTFVRVGAIRVPNAPGGSGGGAGGVGGPTSIADITGLQEALDIRPRMGSGYTPGRTAIINGLGEIVGALGAESDCITIEGASALCSVGSSSASPTTFVDGDPLGGTADGTNPTFSVSHAPTPAASLDIYRNGLLLRGGLDYTAAGNIITFLTGAIPKEGDILVASYRLTGTAPGRSPEILCSSVGTASGTTTAASLGTCTIAANSLHPGERVELFADFTHEGTAQGFSVSAIWGGATLTGRTATSSETNITIRASLGVYTTNTVYGVQSWGVASASAQGAGSLAVTYTTPLTIDFQAALATMGTDTVTLRNYTVIRYPAP